MDEWMNDVKKKVGSCQVTRILENIDFGAVLHSRIIIILCHIVSGFNWYAHYEPTDMHIPCCHNPLVSVAKLLLQKLSERERARVVFPVLCCEALAISRWSHVGALTSFLSFCFIFWSADELLLIRTRRGAIPGTGTANMQLLFVLLQHVLLMTHAVGFECFLCFCYYHDHQYVICCNTWIQVSVPDHPIHQLLLRQLKYPAHHAWIPSYKNSFSL